MAKVQLKAKVTFYNEGRFTVAGDTFSVEEHQVPAYLSRGLAGYADGSGANQATAEAGQKAYEDMTVTELKVIAKEKGMTGYSQFSKQQLVDAIRQSEGTNVSSEPVIAEQPAEQSAQEPAEGEV